MGPLEKPMRKRPLEIPESAPVSPESKMADLPVPEESRKKAKKDRGAEYSGSNDGTGVSQKDISKKLTSFYGIHCPGRVKKSYTSLIEKFEGRYEVLFAQLEEKYAGGSKEAVHAAKAKVAARRAKLSAAEKVAGIAGSSASGAAPPPAPAKLAHPLCCDKCDGPHETASCPHFKKGREKHPDAQRRRVTALGSDGGSAYVRNPRVISQPGDGSCLFHSMNFGLGRAGKAAGGAGQLRRAIATYLRSHPDTRIADTRVEEWIKWDSGLPLKRWAN